MPLQPIIPFEPVYADRIPEGDDWIHQVKWDGVRVLVYKNRQATSLFNRHLNERTHMYPEINEASLYTDASTAILDGEVIALDHTGAPSFHEVMRRDGIRNLHHIPSVSEAVPVYYMIFDIIYCNGCWTNQRPLHERLALLHEVVKPNRSIQIVPQHDDGNALFSVVQQHHLEGIVSKKKDSLYEIKGKNDQWRKIKNYKDLIAIVGGVSYRSGRASSLLLGLFDSSGQLQFIGNAGPGRLTQKEWQTFLHALDSFTSVSPPFMPFKDVPKSVHWLKPVITVKVQYIEWPEGHSLRQPTIQAFVSRTPESCILPD
ncbi:DNA ligase [Bacillus sp. 1P06AnD]|uniref:ATP-dependent DNA ligase n=1 Tax=Bacillus sp. 1P06AnD TaxID=3132208 RepID=UPI0039A028FB